MLDCDYFFLAKTKQIPEEELRGNLKWDGLSAKTSPRYLNKNLMKVNADTWIVVLGRVQ